ncbi:Glutathione S-transferase 1 (Fragment) [Geodia barretti]|uniref:glutathione transferase n=1 Tax=Geodia barretti TaxID=519541 RepID=A0AA35WTK3_GEOBA
MSQYKLTYFNGRGRAELIRLILAQAGVQYEDHRIAGEEWPELKPTTPFGCLPILEVDGKTLGGSAPIAVFVAQRHGLAGANDFENAEIGGIMDYMFDLMLGFMTMHFEKDETRKAALKKKFEEEDCPKKLAVLEKKVTNDGWLYGSKVTYVDLAFFNFSERFPSEVLAKLPGLKGVIDKVGALPNIAKWVKDRPETKF